MRKICLLIALALLLASCKSSPPVNSLPWSDDFSSAGAWPDEKDASAEIKVENGVLRVSITTTDKLAWATAGKNWGDFHLTVEATQAAGPNDNEYGVLARVVDNDNFYRFSISGDGYFVVNKHVAGAQEIMGSNWTPSDAILQGAATNVIEVVCQGKTLTFIVNGQQLAQIEDEQFSRGDVGLYAGSFYESGVEIHFDNLTVVAP